MYYNLNILEDTGIQILNHQILIRISYLINLIPRIVQLLIG